MIEYSKNKKEIITRLRVLLDAIGDTDLDRYIPVKQQPNMVKTKQTKTTTKTTKEKKKCETSS